MLLAACLCWGLHPLYCPCYIPSQHSLDTDSSIKVYLLTFASVYRQNQLKSKLLMHCWTLKKKKIFFLSFLSSSQIRRCQNPKKVCECIIPAVCSKRGRESGKGRKPASHQVTHPGKSTLMISQCYKESTDCMYPSTSEGEEHILNAQYRQVTHSVTAAWVRLCYNVCLLQIKGH